MTDAVLAAEGSENTMVEAHRVWVHLRQLSDGHWAGFGEVVTMPEIAAYALNTDEPGSKVARMRQAAMESVSGITAAEGQPEQERPRHIGAARARCPIRALRHG